MKALILLVGLAALAARSAEAQDERHLKQIFEGKRITLLLDMPATEDGVDITPGSSRPLDFQKYSGRMKKHGVSIKEGEKSLITKIRVKDVLIEVQLGGGGYGTFGDFLSSSLTNNGADSGAAQQLKISNERTQRLSSGSRFNLRFPNGITPDDLEPAAIIKALEEYAAFPATLAAKSAKAAPAPAAEPSGAPVPAPAQAAPVAPAAAPSPAPAAGSGGSLKKGMLEQDVELVAGKAVSAATNGPVTTKKYRWQEGMLEADFVNGVLVGYRFSSGD